MIITGALILSGPYAPDPTYKNLYLYDVIDRPPMSPNAIPRAFFEDLRAPDGSYINGLRYEITFPENTSIYPIGETDTGFTLELPTDDGFPDRPQYIILTDSTSGSPVYRYAFIEGYQRTGSQKIRCDCRYDQWTEHYNEIANAEMSFARRHQKRYVNRTAATRVKLYNGLSDPITEGMVQGTSSIKPVMIYGANQYSGRYIIPIWLYWRLATNVYAKKTGESYGMDVPLYGVDPLKSAVPVIATCLGMIDYDPLTDLAKVRPLWAVYKSDGTLLTSCGVIGGQQTELGALLQMVLTSRLSHPYIIQSWVSTIPPFLCDVIYADSSINHPCIRILDARFDSIVTPGDGQADEYRIGPDAGGDSPAPLYVQNGTFISVTFAEGTIYPEGDRDITTITTNTETGVYDPYYEPKIEESPYEGKELKMYGADIDVSPSPANPSVTLYAETGSHGDVLLLSGSTEIYRASGVCSQYGVDAANDNLTAWLLANYQTYQNTKLWKTIGTLVGGGTSIVGGLVTENPLAVLGGGSMIAKGIGEMISGEKARMADLTNTPNSTTISSENAFDNLPYVDLPRIKARTIPAAIKEAICNYWHVYGYPDNKIGTIADDATLRESFSYVQGALVNTIPGLYPGEYSEVLNAIRAGAWIWKTRTESANVKAVSEWICVDRLTPLLSLQNKEVI